MKLTKIWLVNKRLTALKDSPLFWMLRSRWEYNIEENATINWHLTMELLVRSHETELEQRFSKYPRFPQTDHYSTTHP
jgi:hypothetical protein